jgi:squalene-associated FAD-dependent desaturase
MAGPTNSSPPRIGVVGGGLAGLAAAVALAPRGCHVELFESRRKLGGRAGSYFDRVSGQSIDHCQHVAMGCCTNFLDFCGRTGLDDLLVRHSTLHFFGPDGRRSDFTPSRWLPAPTHLLGPLFSLRYLTSSDKLSIARAMLALVKTPRQDDASCPTVLIWLNQQRQSPAAIERFWKVVLVSALAESLERASLAAARKVFVDGFLANRSAPDILVPRVSLDELYDRRVAAWLEQQGVRIHRETTVATLIERDHRVAGLQLVDGSSLEFDFVIFAVPWTRVGKLLPPHVLDAVDPQNQFATIASSPISSVHLWFDRPITDLPHAVFVEGLSQWIFARYSEANAKEHYYQVVISASSDLAGRDRQAVVDDVFGDLRKAFPIARSASLLRWQLITEQQAVFSVQPGLEAIRPAQQTATPNLLLAGDWTRTGWPATMEGAVRSGYLAAEAVLAQLGRPEHILVPDLPRNWITARF